VFLPAKFKPALSAATTIRPDNNSFLTMIDLTFWFRIDR